MPLIEYECQDCKAHFEILTGVNQEFEAPICPECKSADTSKVFSGFSTKVAGSPVPTTGSHSGGCGSGCGCRH